MERTFYLKDLPYHGVTPPQLLVS